MADSQKMREEYLISVIIPAYNNDRYIQRAIDSVLSQTLPAHEIVVVDDGSTDNTPEILSKYGHQIISVRQNNAGASVARNAAIERATGNWIAFLDADDQWLPFKLERQVRHLQSNPELKWTYGNYWIRNNHSEACRIAFETTPSISPNEVVEDYLDAHVHYSIRTSTLIVTRQAVYEAGLFVPGQNWQDTDLFLKIAYKHPEIGYLHTPTANYYSDTPDSLTARTSRKYLFAEKRCELIERHLNLSQQYNRQKKFMICASAKISYWISVALRYNQYKDARTMLFRLGYLIPIRPRMQLAVQAWLPFFGTMCVQSYFRFKRFLRRLFK